MSTLTLVAGWMIAILVGAFGLAVLRSIFNDKIDLKKLISEENGDASMSRFQFLIFTFVIAMSLFLIIISKNPLAFPDIPSGILALLGISGGSYVVSKGIQANAEVREKEIEANKNKPSNQPGSV